MRLLRLFGLAILGALFVGGWIFGGSTSQTSATSQPITPAAAAVKSPEQIQREAAATAEAEKAKTKARQIADVEMRKLVRSGVVHRFDGGTRTIAGASRIYIDGTTWRLLKVDRKEDVVRFFSRYRDLHEGLPQVTIYDDTTGHELASYGVFSGVTVN